MQAAGGSSPPVLIAFWDVVKWQDDGFWPHSRKFDSSRPNHPYGDVLAKAAEPFDRGLINRAGENPAAPSIFPSGE